MPLRVSCPGPLLRVACLGGGGPVRVPPYLAWGCCCEGRLRSGAPPPPTARPLGGLLGSATHVLWAQVCGCGGPTLSPWPACPVGLRAAGVVWWKAVPGGGWPATVVRGVWCQALLLPRAPVLWGGQPGYRDLCVPGAVYAGVGTQHRPNGSRPCGRALRAVGVAEGRPRCEGRLGSGAPPPPAARPLGGLPGPTTHWLWVRGGADVRTRHQPHSARSCELALRVVGATGGRPGGAPPAWVWGVRGRALSQPRLPALWAGWRGPLPTGCGCRGVRAWGPVTDPTARTLACCGGGMRVPRGGRLLPGCGASGVGRSPTPNCPPSGRAAGAHYPLALGAGGPGVGTRHQPQSARSCELALRAVGAAQRRLGGGATCLGVGRLGSGPLPPPNARPLGGLPGPTTHWLWVRGGADVGTRHQPHSARSCVLWGRHEGARGGRLLPGCGASGVGHSPSPDCPPSGRAAGAH